MRLTDEERIIVEENHNLIYSALNKYNLSSEYYGMFAIELCKAVKHHNPDKGKLSTLFYLMARRAFINEIRGSQAQKRTCNGVIEFNEFTEVYMDELYNIDEISNVDLELTLQSIVGDDIRKQTMLKMKSLGYSNKEVGKYIGVSRTTIGNWLSDIGYRYKKSVGG